MDDTIKTEEEIPEKKEKHPKVFLKKFFHRGHWSGVTVFLENGPTGHVFYIQKGYIKDHKLYHTNNLWGRDVCALIPLLQEAIRWSNAFKEMEKSLKGVGEDEDTIEPALKDLGPF